MTSSSEPIAVLRDCMATTVPAGEWVLLRAGREVQVTQQLGGSITVRTQLGVPPGTFFSKKDLSPVPCGHRIRVTARSASTGSRRGATCA